MELEEMKRAWAGLNARMDKIESNINKQKLETMKTAQKQLIDHYRRFAIIAMAFTGISFATLSRLTGSIRLGALFAAFFALCAVMDSILQRMVGNIDPSTMSVIEVSEKAASCRRLHHIFQLILIPLLVLLIVYLAYTVSDDIYFICGICGGASIGLAFGIRQYFKFMDNYKSLIKN